MEPNIVEEKLLRVKSDTDSNKLAGSIKATYLENPEQKVRLRVIGAGALNQAIKAVIVSNREFSKKGLFATVIPFFKDLPGKDSSTQISAIELLLEYKKV